MSKEWTGACPQKFGPSKLHLQVHKNTEIITSGLYQDIDSGIEQIKGRKHYSQSVEREPKQFNWKPCFKKTVMEKFPMRATGVKKISLPILNSTSRPERRHVTPPKKSTVSSTFNDNCSVTFTKNYTMNNRIW